MFEITSPAKVMTSREVAKLTGKRHDNVMVVAKSLKAEGVCPEIQETPYTNEQNGQQYMQCILTKRDSLVLVARLSPEFTARIVDRWQELEEQAVQPAFNIPQTLPDALRLAADLADKVEQQRLEIRTLEPKAKAADRLAELEESICITEAAKYLKVQRKRLIWLMESHRWMYRRSGKWLAYDDKRYAGLLEHVYHSYTGSEGEPRDSAQLRITPKGLVSLADICANSGHLMNVYTQDVAEEFSDKRYRKYAA
jgi:phage regulator Rha-like protein